MTTPTLKDAFKILDSTPDKVRREVAAMSRREVRTRPAPDKWSVVEILAHLEDIEGIGFRDRIRAILEEVRPTLAAIDQEGRARALRYDRKNPKSLLDSWTRQRRANLRWLKTLRPAQLKRRGVHEKVGRISAEEFIYEWAFHDLGHLKQILEVKRYGLFPRMGNMRQFYRLT
ncbi:MAG: DinB family protein [Terriglobia bacterium]